MDRLDPLRLRKKASTLRLMALEGDDMRLRIALAKLAEDFDQEACLAERRLAGEISA